MATFTNHDTGLQLVTSEDQTTKGSSTYVKYRSWTDLSKIGDDDFGYAYVTFSDSDPAVYEYSQRIDARKNFNLPAGANPYSVGVSVQYYADPLAFTSFDIEYGIAGCSNPEFRTTAIGGVYTSTTTEQTSSQWGLTSAQLDEVATGARDVYVSVDENAVSRNKTKTFRISKFRISILYTLPVPSSGGIFLGSPF